MRPQKPHSPHYKAQSSHYTKTLPPQLSALGGVNTDFKKPRSGIGAMSLLPQKTLYLNNLNSSIKKPLMLKTLRGLFNVHGQVIGVDIVRSKHLRGQAWVTFADQAAATEAMSKLQGFTVFDKPVRVQYAKESNDRVAKREGTFVPKEVKQKREKKRAERVLREKEKEEQASKRQKQDQPSASASQGAADEDDSGKYSDPNAPPSQRLFAPSLPLECTSEMLEVLFSPYAGFIRASLPRPGVGFVEFVTSDDATKAKEALQGFKLTPTDLLQLFYGK